MSLAGDIKTVLKIILREEHNKELAIPGKKENLGSHGCVIFVSLVDQLFALGLRDWLGAHVHSGRHLKRHAIVCLGCWDVAFDRDSRFNSDDNYDI